VLSLSAFFIARFFFVRKKLASCAPRIWILGKYFAFLRRRLCRDNRKHTPRLDTLKHTFPFFYFLIYLSLSFFFLLNIATPFRHVVSDPRRKTISRGFFRRALTPTSESRRIVLIGVTLRTITSNQTLIENVEETQAIAEYIKAVRMSLMSHEREIPARARARVCVCVCV